MNTSQVAADLEALNPEQRAAVEATEGPLLILAGAGSGKTRVLIHRVAHLLEKGVPPWQILAVTFTNKAASEMRARVRDIVGADADRVLVSTFHSACVRFLRSDIEAIGYDRNFTIYDTDDQRRLVKTLCKEHGIDIKAWPVAKIRSQIDAAKVKMQDPDALAESRRSNPGDPIARLYRAYTDHLKVANALDFNDLINHTVKLWAEHPEILARYRDRFRYVMVDEYQDTNHAQYLFIKLLAGEHRNLAVVGDDDQSIYAFRGADIRNILDFEKDFPEAQTVRLERNYRSTSNILEAAHGVVANNHSRMDKKLWTDAAGGDKVQLVVASDEMDEASRVLSDIRKIRQERGFQYGDFAIIYRTNAASRPFEQAFVRARVPHVLVGARKFYERREVRDLLAYLKLLLNPTDDMAFTRVINVPTRGIGAVALRGIQETAQVDGVPLLVAATRWSKAGKGRSRKGAAAFCALLERAGEEALSLPPGHLVSFIAEESGYLADLRAEDTPEAQARLENIAELARAMEEDEALWEDEDPHPYDRLRAFVDRASLAGQQDELPDADEREGQVTLLTAHLAKGLEFPVVYCTGMTEGGFPHHRSLERESELEEERRLVYVAFTRAQKRLVLSRSRRRLVMGAGFQFAEPSRFLDEIPESVVEGDAPQARPTWAKRFSGSAPTAKAPEPAPRPSHLRTMAPEDADAFQPGTRVMHPTFGLGIIRRVEGAPANLKLHIAFDRHGAKSVYARFAKLEVVLS